MKEFLSRLRRKPKPEIPDRVMARLQRSFRKPPPPAPELEMNQNFLLRGPEDEVSYGPLPVAGSPVPSAPPESFDLACPAPARVIAAALGELVPDDQDRVQSHLLTCRDCLDLYLDARLAQVETTCPEPDEPVDQPSRSNRSIHLGSKLQNAWATWTRPRKLLPALAAVSLVLLVYLAGREDRATVPPLPPVALEKREAAPVPPVAALPREPALAPPEPLALKKKPEAPAKEPGPVRSNLVAQAPRPFSLNLAQVPAPGGGFRLAYEADQDVFAHLFRQESSGALTPVFSGRLTAGKTYLYPARGRLGRSAPAAPPTTYHLVAAERPLPSLPAKFQGPKDQQVSRLQQLFPDAVIRSLTVTFP